MCVLCRETRSCRSSFASGWSRMWTLFVFLCRSLGGQSSVTGMWSAEQGGGRVGERGGAEPAVITFHTHACSHSPAHVTPPPTSTSTHSFLVQHPSFPSQPGLTSAQKDAGRSEGEEEEPQPHPLLSQHLQTQNLELLKHLLGG